MTPPPLEDRLNRLADGLVAPPTPEARQAIGHRTGVLRRRRRARQAAGVGALVLAAVAGSIAVTRDTAPEARTDFADHRTALPALTLDVDGWDVVAAEDTRPSRRHGRAASVQLFQRARRRRGTEDRAPALGRLRPRACPSTAGRRSQSATVTGYVRQTGAEDFSSGGPRPSATTPPRSRRTASPGTRCSTFAEGLQSRDDEIQYPPLSGDDVRLRGDVPAAGGRGGRRRRRPRWARAGPAPRGRERLGDGRADDRRPRATPPTGPPWATSSRAAGRSSS